MKNIFHPFLLFISCAGLIVSCNNNDDDNNEDLNAVYNNATSQATYNDVVSIGDESIIDDDLSSFKLNESEKISAPCATITRGDTNAIPNTVTIDFGTSNCLCNDGKYRRGKIIINCPPPSHARDSGAVFHHTFENFYVNDNKVFGFVDVKNIGLSPLGHPHFRWTAEGGLELANAAGTITWMSDQVKAYLEGYNTPNTRLDDKMGIHGGSSGVTQTGESYTAQIDSLYPLRQRFDPGCNKHFFAGTAYLTPQGKPVRTINYGEMTPEVCDNIATVTVNGQTYIIQLDNTHQ